MSNRETVEQMVKAFDTHDVGGLRACLAESYVDHDAMPGMPAGLDGVIASSEMIGASFSDTHTEIEDVIEQGDRLAVRWTWTATHSADFMGTPATNDRVSMQGIEFHRYEDGKLAESWSTMDLMALMAQIGAIEPPGE